MKAGLVTCIKLLVQYCVLGGHRRTMAGDDDGRDLVDHSYAEKRNQQQSIYAVPEARVMHVEGELMHMKK